MDNIKKNIYLLVMFYNIVLMDCCCCNFFILVLIIRIKILVLLYKEFLIFGFIRIFFNY